LKIRDDWEPALIYEEWSQSMTCQEFEELSGAYALGALSEEECREAEAHLAQCTHCPPIAQELQQIVSKLPLAAPPMEPSPQLKERIMLKIRETQSKPRPKQAVSKQKSIAGWKTSLVAAAAVLLLAFSGAMTAWNISLHQQIAQLTGVSVSIQGSGQGSGAHGQLTYLPQQHVTILTIRGLPELQGAQLYQGWTIQNKQPASIGILSLHNGTATLNVPGDARAYEAIAISLEPGPQSSQGAPRGPIVALHMR
jgi:anti-sigma-K factor RskA